MARKTAKANVTRKINEITELIKDVNNFERVQSVYSEFEEALRKFEIAQVHYRVNLTDEDDAQESDACYDAEMRRTSAFRDKISDWLYENSFCPKIQSEQLIDIKPSDSVSNVGTDLASNSSRKSKAIRSEAVSMCSRASSNGSTRSAKGVAAAKRAALKEEAIRLQRRQELQKQELLIQQQKEELELEIKLAQAAAEERTYSSSEIGTTQPENTNSSQCRDKVHASSINAVLMRRPREGHSKINVEAINQLGNTQSSLSTPLNSQAKNWNEVSRREANMPDDNRRNTFANEQLNKQGEHFSASPQANYPQETRTQDMKIMQLLTQQQQQTLALTLPSPKVPIFHGNPIDFHSFIQAFEQLIESKTQSDSSRLYYLLQYTSGDVHDLMRSCLSMSPEEGYKEARRLLKAR